MNATVLWEWALATDETGERWPLLRDAVKGNEPSTWIRPEWDGGHNEMQIFRTPWRTGGNHKIKYLHEHLDAIENSIGHGVRTYETTDAGLPFRMMGGVGLVGPHPQLRTLCPLRYRTLLNPGGSRDYEWLCEITVVPGEPAA